ncbi:DDE-type integrase/transposase/recombinase [Maribrevibacterium harenarium]|uniref:DDE-type integrase/transposase/recombinase n=1 Tax=Maribrevibacterium harenarium TaxID=2589817 RepID=A0A501WBH1_9GAMM|nr:DDE-type integrase/transposase/recombinase [Maribrevibacterium harenarium]TPE44551.1 DDE-type integrase/transposase/recombinase [Maribrevibacterium harenarium]
MESNNTLISLVDRHHLKGNRDRKCEFSTEKFFEESIDRFLKAERPSIASAYRLYEKQCLIHSKGSLHSYRPMSKSSFYKRVEKLNSYEVAVKRFGKNKADILYSYKGKIVKPERIMQRVEIDHTPLDIILLDDETLTPIGRPYLTLLKDVYSGCLVGYHITFKAPQYASVAKAICNAILPKERSKQLWNIDWPCHGKIETLVTDNGAEFWSGPLEHLCYELGIHIQYNRPGQPWQKPYIERSFRTINDLFLVDLAGKTFSSIDARKNYNPVENSKIKFSNFIQAFEKWVAEVYNCSPDTRNTKVPSVLWQEALEKMPPAELSNSQILELPKLAGLKETRAIQPSGITYNNLRYDSEDLSDYRKRYLSMNRTSRTTIKVDVDDLSHIYVYLPELEKYLTVPCVDQFYTQNLSLDQHLINRSFVKAHNLLMGKSDVDLAMANQEIREILADHDAKAKSSTKIKTSKKAAQYKGYSNESVKNKVAKPTSVDEKSSAEHREVSELEALWNSFRK